MHTTRAGSLTIIHHSDFSGDAFLVVNKLDIQDIQEPTFKHVRLDGDDILTLAAEIVRRRRLERLELATDDDILDGKV